MLQKYFRYLRFHLTCGDPSQGHLQVQNSFYNQMYWVHFKGWWCNITLSPLIVIETLVDRRTRNKLKVFPTKAHIVWCEVGRIIVTNQFFKVLFIYFTRVWAGEGQRKREAEIENSKQTPHCQHRARCTAWTHKLWDHDLGQNQELDA